jgi:NAD(P)-dependent dehydrogenase (short-subunit alcohol dehydrogenase family)
MQRRGQQLFGDLSGRTALVTGASEGIGRGLALGLARAGADIVACSRRRPELEGVCDEIRDMGRRAEVQVLDVGNLESINAAKQFCVDAFDRIEILVNNAAVLIPREAWSVTESDWDSTHRIGLKGLFFCCQALGSIMRRHSYGKIINISSTLATSVRPGSSVYATVKAGVSHLTRALAIEWASDGIRVNALAPTTTPTPSRLPGQTPEVIGPLVARIPLGRQGTIQDLVPAAVFLAGQESDFVTGQTIFVDGGWSAHGGG